MKYDDVTIHYSPSTIISEFDAAPDYALFPQSVVALIQKRSLSSVERDRWIGIGIPFVKHGRSVRYRKKDILQWLEAQKAVKSTTEAQYKAPK